MKTNSKKLFFTRHGKTKYTGVFPDLTPEGEQEARTAAIAIRAAVDQLNTKNVVMVSSPLPRALGTASIIASALVYPQHAIKEELAIRSMDFYDKVKAEAIWASFASARAVDIAYPDDSLFEDGSVIEKRSDIQHRFYRYLGKLFERFAANDLPDVMVHTTHYEVLWHLARRITDLQKNQPSPLSHCEVIEIDLLDVKGGRVEARFAFRGCAHVTRVSLPSGLFRAQF